VSDLTKTITLNSDETIGGSKSVVDKVLSIDDEDYVLNQDVANHTTDILENFLNYLGENDCSLENNLTQSIETDF